MSKKVTTNDFWFNNTTKTRFLKVTNQNFIPFLKKTLPCENCGTDVEKHYQRWIAQCKRCKRFIYFFHPTNIQKVAYLAETSLLFNIGGYGSGKTTISAYIFATMLRQIPGARLICIAQTLQQLKKNAISELDKFIHPSEIKTKTTDTWTLFNGSYIEFWPSDDPDKLKSANANFIWLVEANTHALQKMYNEALARIRNDKGFIYQLDDKGDIVLQKRANGQVKPVIQQVKNMIIIEANPEHGAWTNKKAYNAHTIIHTENVRGISLLKEQTKPTRGFNVFTDDYMNTDVVVILNATIDNPTLPDDYFINLKERCKTQEEYDRIVYCDITSQSGLVFKDIIANKDKHFSNIQEFRLTKQSQVFVESLDPGGSKAANDPDAYILGVLDKETGVITLLDGFKESGLSFAESAQRIWFIRNKWGWRRDRHFLFTGDTALNKASKHDRNASLASDYQIRLQVPIQACADKWIHKGIQQVISWFQSLTLVINTNMDWLKQELFSYEKLEQAKVIKGTLEVQYVDAYSEYNNHGIDALRYLVVKLESLGFRPDNYMIDHMRVVTGNNVEYLGSGPAHNYTEAAISDSLRSVLPVSLGGKIPLVQHKNIKKFFN